MKYIIIILVLILSISCKQNRLESTWIHDKHFECPYIIKFTDDILLTDLTSNHISSIYHYKIIDHNKIVIKLISENIFGTNDIDTLSFKITKNVLSLDSINYLRIGFAENYYEDLLSVNSFKLKLPKLSYKNIAEKCAFNSVLIPYQSGDSLSFFINGYKINHQNSNEIYRYITYEDLHNTVRFIVDKNTKYLTINQVRNYFRRIGMLLHEFIYLPNQEDKLNYFDTYALLIRSIPMSNREIEFFDINRDTFDIPPPPPPIPNILNIDNFTILEILNENDILFSDDTVKIEDLQLKQLKQLIDKNMFLIMKISDLTTIETYLQLRSKIQETLYNLRDSISMSLFNEHYEELVYESRDSIYELTNLKLFELNQLIEPERKIIEKKYGLQQGI